MLPDTLAAITFSGHGRLAWQLDSTSELLSIISIAVFRQIHRGWNFQSEGIPMAVRYLSSLAKVSSKSLQLSAHWLPL